jgi:hypothetical protein
MDPSSGRFWSMDSYEGGSYDPGSLHKYLYTRNNPTNLVDPSGHFSLVDTLNTSVLVGVLSGFTFGLVTGGLEGAINGAIQGATMGALVPLTGAGVGTYLLGNAARGVFVVGWGAGLASAVEPGFNLATATNDEDRLDAGLGLLTTAAFMYFGPKLLQRANTKLIGADQANAEFYATRKGMGEPPWPNGLVVTETTIFRSGKYVRVYAEGKTKPIGAWVMEASEIEGLTLSQIQQKFALPFRPTHIVSTDLPAGTTIRIGMAGPNKFGPGGGMQVQIMQP